MNFRRLTLEDVFNDENSPNVQYAPDLYIDISMFIYSEPLVPISPQILKINAKQGIKLDHVK